MYEFDEDRSDEQEANADEFRGITQGWLIELAADPGSRMSVDRPHLGYKPETDPPRYLQIGTGQWCGAEYATLFPLYSTAVVYAKEFGCVVGKTVRIVKHRF